MTGFIFATILGFKRNLWWVVGALFANGVYDFFHGHLFINPGVEIFIPLLSQSHGFAGVGGARTSSSTRTSRRLHRVFRPQFLLPLLELLRLFCGRGRRKFTGLPGKKTPLTLFFAPDRQKAEDAVGLARRTGGFHMGTPALERDAGSGKGKVPLFKVNDVIFGATADDALDVRSLGVH